MGKHMFVTGFYIHDIAVSRMLMRSSFFGFYIFSVCFFSSNLLAQDLPNARVTVIASGTVNWELEYIKDNKIDHQNGYNLVINKVASLPAARIAITAGNADFIVSDWLWASDRNAKGENLRFIPFSRQVGSVIADRKSALTKFSDLKGKRIGIAGGPLNKGWVLMRAAALREGINLENETEIQFGAPPLLNQAMRRGRLDLLVTFWHYGARLEAEGFKKIYSLNELMVGLGLQSNVPMLGYLYDADFGVKNEELVDNFLVSINQAKADLLNDNGAWDKLRPLMKAESDDIYKALVQGYRDGTPSAINFQQVNDAARFYKIIDDLKPYPTGNVLSPELFHKVKQ
jgi:NitT/TauT family transport system substrate-binding protein